MPLLPADFTHAKPCKPFCEKSLTLPKNPLAGSRITAPSVGEILRDIPGADGAVLTQDAQAQPA